MVIKRMMEIKMDVKKSANMKSSLPHLITLILLMTLSSCGSTIGVRSPLNSFISPEAAGETLKGEVNGYLSISSKNNIELDSFDGTIKKTVGRDDEIEDTIGLNGSLGIIDRLDIVGVSPGSKTPTLFGLKYQLLGQRRIKASKGNHSLSIVGLFGSQISIQENDDAIELIAEDEEAKTEMTIETSDIRLIYGYRFQEMKMIYAGLSSVNIQFEGELESDNAAFNGESISGGATAIGAHLGLAFYAKQAFHMKIEAAGQKIKWRDNQEITVGTLIASLGLFWN